MKVLTVSEPYASLIASGEKWVENRRWPTQYRGRLIIHAGKGTQYLTKEELRDYPAGKVVAVCDLASCLFLPSLRDIPVEARTPYSQSILAHPHTEGPWCWVLKNVRKLQTPIAAVGAQGLWEPSAVLLEEIKKQIQL